MTSLRTNLIRLASSNPGLRPHILEVLKVGMEFDSPEALDKYLKDHPGADRSKHKVVKPKKDAPTKAEPAKAISVPNGKNLGGKMQEWAMGGDILSQVGSHLYGGHAVAPEKLEAAAKHVETMLADSGWNDAEKKELTSMHKAISKAIGKKPAEKSKEPSKSKEKKPSKPYSKNYGKSMESVMDKHSLTDEDAEQVLDFKKDRPRKGKPQSPAELMRRFMQHAKPETKERMKGVSPADFVKMLGVIFDDEEMGGGAGKVASVRAQVIRLAHMNEALRPHLLPLLKEAMEFPTQDALDKYLKDHPDADKSNHSVAKPKDEGDSKKEEGGPSKGKSFNQNDSEVKEVLGLPAMVGKKDADKWMSGIKMKMYDYAPGSDDRKKYLAEAARSVGYGSFVYRNRALGKHLDSMAKELKSPGLLESDQD